jgi:hypothetical protein
VAAGSQADAVVSQVDMTPAPPPSAAAGRDPSQGWHDSQHPAAAYATGSACREAEMKTRAIRRARANDTAAPQTYRRARANDTAAPQTYRRAPANDTAVPQIYRRAAGRDPTRG